MRKLVWAFAGHTYHLLKISCRNSYVFKGGSVAYGYLTLKCLLIFFSSCREEDGTLKVSEVKSGPLMKQDLDSSVSWFLSHGPRDANHSDFCGNIPIFKADFRITILDVKIREYNNFSMDQIK